MICPRLLTVLTLACVASCKDGDELKAVVVLFRHGDRAPLSSWPNDIYFGDSSLWPDGYGQLNNMGKERHYLLGQWFRQRYDGFLPKRYNRSDIYVKSTDVDRTLMSAASNLAGLYPPEGDQVWNENVPWQAIPIHTIPEEQDAILATAIPCPKHDRLKQELMNSEEFQKRDQDLAEFYKNISEVTGYAVESMNVAKFGSLFGTLTIYRGMNLTLPSWVEYYWSDIKALAPIKYQLPTYTAELARLRAGPFVDYLLNHFEALLPTKHIKGPNRFFEISAAPKFLMLSAHDTTIGDITNALGIYPDAAPEFASTVIWEIKSDQDDYVYVNMYFKNSTDFTPLKLPSCELDCNLDNFAIILSPLKATVKEWMLECNETDSSVF